MYVAVSLIMLLIHYIYLQVTDGHCLFCQLEHILWPSEHKPQVIVNLLLHESVRNIKNTENAILSYWHTAAKQALYDLSKMLHTMIPMIQG